jgi:hypothetical protein
VRLTGPVLVATLATAGVAQAATPVARDDVTAGVALAGPRVVWGSTTPGGGLEVRSGAPGSAPITLFAFPPPRRPSTHLLGGIAASATHLAIVRTASRATGKAPKIGAASDVSLGVVQPGESSTTLVAGPLGGPFLHVAGRRGPKLGGRSCRTATAPSGPVLSGSVLAYLETETTCPRGGPRLRDRIVVRDLARPAEPPRVVARGRPYWPGGEPRVSLGDVRVAGRYVAWQETHPGHLELSRAKVLDLRTRRVVRVVTKAPGGDLGDLIEWFAVGADGSLVVSYQKDETGHGLALIDRRGRAGPVEMRPARGDRGYEPSSVAVSYLAGRIAFLAETGRGEFGFVLARRTGTAAPLARFTAGRPIIGDPAWNGTYAAWASRRGRTTTIWRAVTTAPPRSP